MFRNLGAKLLLLTLLFVVSTADLLAQTSRVRFARGRNSATLSGTLTANGGSKGYVLRAQRGQTLTATLSSTNGKVDFMQGARHDTQYSQTVENDGDVYISVDNHGGGRTRYSLTISIQ
jgi:hypothetical protein